MTTQRVLVLGRSGSGKSRYLAAVAARLPRVLWIDVTDGGLPGSRDVSTVGSARRALLASDRWSLRWTGDRDGAARLIETLLAWRHPRGVAVFCDELGEAMGSGVGRDRLYRALRSCYVRGRGAGVSVYGASQWPTQVDRAASSQATAVVCFQLWERLHLDWLARNVSEVFALEVSRLAPFHSLVYRLGESTAVLYDARYLPARRLTLRQEWGKSSNAQR